MGSSFFWGLFERRPQIFYSLPPQKCFLSRPFPPLSFTQKAVVFRQFLFPPPKSDVTLLMILMPTTPRAHRPCLGQSLLLSFIPLMRRPLFRTRSHALRQLDSFFEASSLLYLARHRKSFNVLFDVIGSTLFATSPSLCLQRCNLTELLEPPAGFPFSAVDLDQGGRAPIPFEKQIGTESFFLALSRTPGVPSFIGMIPPAPAFDAALHLFSFFSAGT